MTDPFLVSNKAASNMTRETVHQSFSFIRQLERGSSVKKLCSMDLAGFHYKFFPLPPSNKPPRARSHLRPVGAIAHLWLWLRVLVLSKPQYLSTAGGRSSIITNSQCSQCSSHESKKSNFHEQMLSVVGSHIADVSKARLGPPELACKFDS